MTARKKNTVSPEDFATEYEKILYYYDNIKAQKLNLLAPAVSASLRHLAVACHRYLSTCPRTDLESKVMGKEYFSFGQGDKLSRAIRKDLFEENLSYLDDFLTALESNNFAGFSGGVLDKCMYTIAISFCAVIDLQKRGDQKTPGTFFEYFAGHCVAKRFNIEPTR